MKQEALFKSTNKESHGGDESKGKRKTARPIVTKSPMHVTFSSTRARGAWSLFRYWNEIESVVSEAAKRWGVRVYLRQNVGSHLHLAVQAASRRGMQNFLREVGGRIAALVTKARKGNAIGRFWDALVHSSVVHWGKDWLGVKQYFEKNRIEAAGVPRAIVDRCFDEIREAIRGEPPRRQAAR